MTRSVVLHGHYYQPPREDPWLEQIERQPSAAPFHDWNERIERECYRAVVAARVLDPSAGQRGAGRIARVVNTLAYTSFDFGPTLLEWLERAAPDTYAAVLHADRASAARLGGHGNAMAQAYHHAILPLASRRDKTTEVRWGVADFRERFGRAPEGLWLPETAVDDETLDVLACEGIRFTVLASHQVEGAPVHGMPGLYRTSGGREIALFVYDGPMSHGIAFGGLLADAERWEERLVAGLREEGPDELLSAASDGETYGHHHRFGEMALAAVIDRLTARRGIRLENFASVLARHPARTPVTLVAPSSWSCAHGVARWQRDCGCGASTTAPSQQWRAPLRRGMEELAAGLHEVFEREGAEFFADVWKARNEYGSEVGGWRWEQTSGRSERGVPTSDLRPPTDVRALELLELQRNALRLFTSCAWFFDDVDRLEPLQVMRYAARAIELAGDAGPALEARLLDTLALAKSNDPESGTGRDVYLRKAKPAVDPYARVAAAHAIARALGVTLASPGGEVRVGEERIVVRERRTGREHAYAVALADTGDRAAGSLGRLRHAAVDVRTAGAPASDAVRLTIEDVPDAERAQLDALVRRAMLGRALDDAERSRLAAGREIAEVVPEALVRVVAALGSDRSPAAVARVLDLLDFLAETGLAVPFDAQTAFARVREELAGGAVVLAGVAERLGFAERLSAAGARRSALARSAESRAPAAESLPS